MPLLRTSTCNCCPAMRENFSAQAPSQPPMSQKLDQEKTGGASAPPPPPPPTGSSGWGTKLAIGAAGICTVGGIALAYDENSRLAAVERMPAFQTAFDILGWETQKKGLPPAPIAMRRGPEYDVMSIADKSVAKMKQPSHEDQTALSERKSAKPAAAAVHVTHSQSDPILPNRDNDGALISNIAEDSVRFLLSGKRTPEEEAALEKCRDEAEKAHRDYLENQHRSKLQREKEEREADAAKQLAKKKHCEAENEKQMRLAEERECKNRQLEQLLSKEISCAIECAHGAVRLNKLALDACRLHTSELRCAMDAAKDKDAQEHWPRVCELRDVRIARVKEAQNATEAADKYLDAFLDFIASAKKDEMTKCNPALPSYKKQAEQIAGDLHQASAMLENAESVDKVMKYYYQLLQRDRNNFHEDLEENLPDFKPGGKGSNLSEEELNALLAHAHQRIFQLKRNLRAHQVMEDQRIKQVLSEKKDVHDKDFAELLRSELDTQRCKCLQEKQEELMKRLDCHEQKMREELVRQSLAQNNHMNDMLKLQQNQLIEEFKQVMEERAGFERSTYVDSLAKHIARVDGLVTTTSEKADVDKCLRDVRELASSSQCLFYTVLKRDADGSVDDQVINIAGPLARCQKAAEDSKFIQTILSSVPTKAKDCGILSSSSLERRFDHVVDECKKAAIFPKSSNIVTSTFSSLLSKMAIYSVKPVYTTEYELEQCGVDGMDAKELLIQAQYFMKRQSLPAALKCMIQLDGVPHCLAQNWIEEARLYLEVKQVSEVLYAYAMSKCSNLVL